MLQMKKVMISICFILTIKETRLNCFKGSWSVLQKMANMQEVGVKLTNAQLNISKLATKNKKGTAFRINKKHFPRWIIDIWFISNSKINSYNKKYFC